MTIAEGKHRFSLPTTELSGRERQILAYKAEGMTNREIAGYFGSSPESVKTQCWKILRKLGCRSMTQAVAKAIKSAIL